MYSKLLDLWIWLLLSTSIIPGVRADWWSKTKRDIPANSGGITIPLSTDALGRYIASVGMGNIGKAGPVQNLSFVLSTSSPYTAVAGVNCATCVSQIGSSSLYNASLSQTQVPLNGTQSISLGTGSVKGSTISEACGLRQQNGSFWVYPNQTVIVANQSNSFFANGASGLVGLGRSGGDASFISTAFRAHAAWDNLTIGLALGLENAGSMVGVMDLRATDSSYYDGDVKYAPVLPAATDVPTNYPADWSLHLDSWTVDTGGVRTEHTTGGVAIVEPYFPEIRFPQDQALLFYRDVSGAVMLNDSTGLTWSIPCKPTLSLNVIFSGTPFSIGSAKLVDGDVTSGNCTGVVRGWDNPFVQSYMLGKAFAETVYIVYNANRNGTGDTLGFAPRSNSSTNGLSTGAVAGISVGATIAFFLLLIILFLWWRHKRAVRITTTRPVNETGGRHKIEPYTPTSSSTPMFNLGGSAPNHGPYVIEQGPIGGDVGQTTALLSATTPDASPSTATIPPSHRRKAEEAGFLVSNGRGSIASRGRPSSSQTATTSTDYMQNIPSLLAAPTISEEPPISALPSSPGGATGGGPTAPSQQPSATLAATNPDPSLGRHLSTDTRILSPLSPQIHYHIHVTPDEAASGFLPGNIPPGAIIHEYNEDEPAPEYSERPGSHHSSGSEPEQDRVLPVPPTTTTTSHT